MHQSPARRNAIEEWLAAGFQPVPIIPIGVDLVERSKVKKEDLGKIPGLREEGSDLWHGFNWESQEKRYPRYRRTMMEQSALEGGVGLLGEVTIGVDLDILDIELAAEARELVVKICGWAPTRTGQAPKCLLMYRLPRAVLPYSTRIMRWRMPNGRDYGIEIIAKGRQFVVDGIHPKTLQPYTWDAHPLDYQDMIPDLPPEKLRELLPALTELMERAGGVATVREARGGRDGTNPPQREELAGEERLVLAALAYIPNNPETSREEWIEIGHALKAAAGTRWPVAAELAWTEWSLQWEPPEGHAPNTEESCADNWARMKPPFWLGADFIYARAAANGWSRLEVVRQAFAAEPLDPAELTGPDPIVEERQLTREEQIQEADVGNQTTIARWFLRENYDRLLYIEDKKTWKKFDGNIWVPGYDERLTGVLGSWVGAHMARHFPPGSRDNDRMREKMATYNALSSILKLVRGEARSLRAADLGARTDILVTPGGTVELRRGLPLRKNHPDDYQTAMTTVAPGEPGGPPPKMFLETLSFACFGVPGAVRYVQLALGNMLLGNPAQVFLAFWGPGSNGKSTALKVILSVLGEGNLTDGLATSCTTDMWQQNVAFSTQLLGGRRAAITPEMDGGEGWNEALLKAVTGGDTLQARDLHQSYGSQRSACMPIFAFNTPPSFREITPAIRRRAAVIAVEADDSGRLAIPVSKRDGSMAAKIYREEGPAVLRWMLNGVERVLAGENAAEFPPGVADGTDRLMAQTDPIAAWLLRNLEEAPGSRVALLLVAEAMQAQWQDSPDENERARLMALSTPNRVGPVCRRLGLPVMRGTGGAYVIVGRKLRREFSEEELEAIRTGTNVEAFDAWKKRAVPT